ncbi:MAG: hypothetical protein OMM_04251 [Candidatus Magnetoglobus multicellularis str. Araruama]|uniref:Uncharacterized protein n=1 Tax=Candidatus Magnetoglobus multicellularis str. Araruama TaxID=890399 RepID=A0A1V1P2C2_9BACT|nr:MAG: hypothetical protein OMM_04251 [Candidatus Magnetoglobus multicellularis str. Araruama]
MIVASIKGHLEIVKYLVEHGAHISTSDIEGMTAVKHACEQDHFEIMKYLIEKGGNIFGTFYEDDSALGAACWNGNIDMVKYLIDIGFDISEKHYGGRGWNVLMIATDKGHTHIVKYLLEKGADFSVKGTDAGWTPLMLASYKGYIGAVKYLLKKGADPTSKNNEGMNALMYASQEGHVAIVKLLIENGSIYIPATNNKGKNALMLSTSHLSVFKILIENGADISNENTRKSLVLYALLNENYDILKFLSEKGINLPKIDNYHSDDMNDLMDAIYKSFNNKNSSLIQNNIYIANNKNYLCEPLYDWELNKKNNKIQFLNPIEISFDTLNFGEGDDPELTIGKIYEIGHFTKGSYKDYNLYTIDIKERVSCEGKSYGCYNSCFLRFTIKQGSIIIFSSISTLPGTIDTVEKLLIEAYGMIIRYDESFTIPLLECPETVFIKEKNVELTFYSESKVKITKKELKQFRKIFFHNRLGECYEGGDFKFNFFRPDGTVLEFQYHPPFFPFPDLDINLPDDLYNYDSRIAESYCSPDDYYGELYEVYSFVIKKDLVEIGESKTLGKLYNYKDINHNHLKTMFEKYKKSLMNVHKEFDNYKPWAYFDNFNIDKKEIQQMQQLTFDQFLKRYPILFWIDPFDRLIPIFNVSLSAPCMVEPMIYLYPESELGISIKFGEELTIDQSYPMYNDGWNVIANPLGMIKNISDGKTYDKLFWEGRSYIIKTPEKGFLVSQSNLEVFLYSTLPKMNLNQKETDDFINAWLPKFPSSPYYFITFIHQYIIDILAPITITPKPDTIIRVLMDYRPLNEPIDVEMFKFPPKIERKGFVVVEWGGVYR